VSTRHKDLEEALAAYGGAGFRQVELVLPHIMDWLAAGHTMDDVRRLLAAHNLRPIGGFETSVECFSAPELRRANHNLHRANAQLLHDLGGGRRSLTAPWVCRTSSEQRGRCSALPRRVEQGQMRLEWDERGMSAAGET
jgi:sugar phosphate isomerase/epimerase